MVDEMRLFYLNLIPIKRSSDSPHRRETNTCDCGGSCGGCGKQRKETYSVSYVYCWEKDPNRQSVTYLYRYEKESPALTTERMGHLHDMGGGVWSFTFEYDNVGIPKGRHVAFGADGYDAAKRYVETNVLPGITVAPDNAEQAAAEVALDKQEDCGFFWNGGVSLYFNAVKENPDWPNCWRGLICTVVYAGKDSKTWKPLWCGPFEDDKSYPFYAPSLDAARRAIEEKAREKIEANYDKWARLKEAWKPLGE